MTASIIESTNGRQTTKDIDTLTVASAAPVESRDAEFNQHLWSLFTWANKTLFDNELGSCIVQFDTGNGKAAGGFRPIVDKKTQRDIGYQDMTDLSNIPCIWISPSIKWLNRDFIDNVVELVHQMMHMLQHQDGSEGNRMSSFHNANFTQRMLSKCYIIASSDGTTDGKSTGQKIECTAPEGGKFRELVQEALDNGEISPHTFKLQVLPDIVKKDPKKPTFKLVCKGCGLAVKVADSGQRLHCSGTSLEPHEIQPMLPQVTDDKSGDQG